MTRLLVIPAAGLGSRLGSALPKVLVPVAGVPMLDRILELYRAVADRVVVITHPAFTGQVERHVRIATAAGSTVSCSRRRPGCWTRSCSPCRSPIGISLRASG
jgi:2-C-methyl-D-erythritol 4-phosphate cytidylyltransferase